MANGKGDPQCGNCVSWETDDQRHGYCSRHDFTMPSFGDYVVCCDWQSRYNPEGGREFGRSLKSGVLYRWEPYTRVQPEPVGRFQEINELLLDHNWDLFENPDHGWCLQLREWDHELFPEAGNEVNISLDGEGVPFVVRDEPVTTTYTHRSANGELIMEDRTELKRIVVPLDGHEILLREWIEQHHDLAEARTRKEASLRDPRNLYKDKVLRLMIRVIGRPNSGYYEFQPSE